MSIFFLYAFPLLAGFLLLFRQVGKGTIAKAVSFLGLAFALAAFIRPPHDLVLNFLGEYSLVLGLNAFSRVILVFINLFVFLVCCYSKDYLREGRAYFSYLLWLLAFSNLTVFAADFITFIFAWGATLTLLYALLALGSGNSARKALGILGLADFSLILGICLYIMLTDNNLMPHNSGIALDNPVAWLSFALMLSGALAKAGCGPFHTWIPQASTDAPITVMAILPGSLDKLLGIYLLARVCTDFFVLNNIVMALLLLIGSLTIIFAVLMALIQHDLRKLLSYHAISQVGYMVLGFGTGVPIGIFGGIFHMINNALYKTGLFLAGGAVEKQKKTFALDKLGGLATFMPLTFISALVFSLSISGVPPFNGFASKWMLYQGAILGFSQAQGAGLRLVYIFALVAAMFGSALTLASFIKFIHAIFLGQDNSQDKKQVREAPLGMVAPLLVLAGLCVVLGVFPAFFIRNFLEPAASLNLAYTGTWNSLLAFVFLSSGLLIGFILWRRLRSKGGFRQDGYFIGGETTPLTSSFPATEFYRTVQEIPAMARAYRMLNAEERDLYNIVRGTLNIFSYTVFTLIDRLIYLLTNAVGYLVLGLSFIFRKMHSGVLDMYLAWSLAGLIGLFFMLMLKIK